MSSLPPITEPAPSGDERPTCYGCGKDREPEYLTIDETGQRASGWDDGELRRVWAGRWKGYGHFHSMECATRYANWIANHYQIRLTVKEEAP